MLTEEVLAEAGMGRHRFRARDLGRIRRGVYAEDPAEAHPFDVAAALARKIPHTVVCGVTAAQFHGLRLPADWARTTWLHLARTDGRSAIRRPRVRGTTAVYLPGDLQSVDGVPVTTPERTFIDLARLLGPRELVVVGDGLVVRHEHGVHRGIPPLTTVERLAESVESHAGLSGVRRARAALGRVRVGSDSPKETELRLDCEDHGIDGWVLDHAVEIDGVLVQPDLLHRESGLFVQYDGAHHADPRQIGRDIRRQRRTEASGHRELRIFAEDLVVREPFHGDLAPRAVVLVARAVADLLGEDRRLRR